MNYRNFLKRILDIGLSLTGLLLLSPVIIIVSIGLLIYNRRSGVFFFQDRPGKDEKIFKLVKFKTMNDRKDIYGNLLPTIERTTPLGRMLRKYSLDELPQLINVVKGDMSIIGPRPLLVQYLPLYNDEQKRRHLVKPGITGWAQVNGRNAIAWSKKFELDIYYVDNLSLFLDLKIIYLTLIKVVKGSGVNSSDSNTMPTFNGNN